ncbi:Pristinol synthase [Apiospora marii]|uniref:Pristinol synthase n=1 Tax=Apiospora marii TaxID=335849 RepID=A0ABR1RXD4_9PEZI
MATRRGIGSQLAAVVRCRTAVSSIAARPLSKFMVDRRQLLQQSRPLSSERDRILSQLHGQTIRIPNLLTRGPVKDWPCELNPHSYAVSGKVTDMLTRYCTNPILREALQNADIDGLLGGWYPRASLDRLEALIVFQSWMFIVDDMLDTFSDHRNFNSPELEELHSQTIGYVYRSLGLPEPDGYARDTYTDPAVLAYAEFGRAVAEKCTLSQRQRVATEAKFTFDCYRMEWENRLSGRMPTLPYYRHYRQGSSCIRQVVTNLEYANALTLPDAVMRSPEMDRLQRAVVARHWINNDIVSLGKEFRAGFLDNLVVLLAGGGDGRDGSDGGGGMDAQRGIDRAVAELDAATDAMLEAEARLLAKYSGTAYGAQIETLTWNAKNMITTNMRWSFNNARYGFLDRELDSDGNYVMILGREEREAPESNGPRRFTAVE